jgi:hypothetical protein
MCSSWLPRLRIMNSAVTIALLRIPGVRSSLTLINTVSDTIRTCVVSTPGYGFAPGGSGGGHMLARTL